MWLFGGNNIFRDSEFLLGGSMDIFYFYMFDIFVFLYDFGIVSLFGDRLGGIVFSSLIDYLVGMDLL